MSIYGLTSSRLATSVSQARQDVRDLSRMDPASDLVTQISDLLGRLEILVRRLRVRDRDPDTLLRYRAVEGLVDPATSPCPSHSVEMNGVAVAAELLVASALYSCTTCGKIAAPGPTWQYLGSLCPKCQWPTVQRVTCSNQCRR